MIWGYPGRTDRYATSWSVDATLNDLDPAIVKIFGTVLENQKAGMDKDNAVRIAYASTYKSLANTWKNKMGEARDLKRLDVVQKKQELEARLQQWINADAQRKAKYGDVLSTYADVYRQMKDQDLNQQMYYGRFIGSKAFSFPGQSTAIETVLKSGAKGDDLKKQMEKYKETSKEHFKEYNNEIEQNVYAALLTLFRANIPASQQPAIFQVIDSKYKGDINKYVAEMFKNSIFLTEANFNAFLDKPNLKKLQKDPALLTYNSFNDNLKKLQPVSMQLSGKLRTAQRLFVEALREMDPSACSYPDANSTMRMTYGKVLDYFPADAVHYNYYTTIDGIMAKEDPKNEEFIVPAKLKELYNKKDYGRYGEDGKLYTCFLTDNDITGGNSGSPVINGNGELIGLAFDGNWEAMSGNILFEPALQRTICVDVRYVLFVIDKYAGASNLMKELKIVQ
jgi:hypothetical protein